MLINPAIAGLTFRQTLAKRRWMIVLLLAALPVVLAVVIRAYSADAEDAATGIHEILMSLSLTIIVPVIALVLASSGFGAEVDDGTVVYLLTKPISRAEIVATKVLVTSLVCVAFAALSTFVAGQAGMHGLANAGRHVLGFTVGAALGSLLYSVIFLALGLITRRGMLIGLVYIVIWEGVLSSLFPGTRSLSVKQYMFAVTDAIANTDTATHLTTLVHSTAYQMSAIVAVAAFALCVHRLKNFQVGQSA